MCIFYFMERSIIILLGIVCATVERRVCKACWVWSKYATKGYALAAKGKEVLIT